MAEQEYDTSVEPEVPVIEAPVTPVVEAPAGEAEGAAVAPEVGLASPTFTVKVNGVEEQVTMEEALQGYQRQSDYTRKTQELASERETLSQAQRLWDAIENNPQSTIAAIASAYGFVLTPQQAAAAEAQRQGAEDPFADLVDEEAPKAPEDPRWAQVQAFMQDQEAQAQTALVRAELAEVHTKYGVSFDDNALLDYAVENNIGSLDAAFRAMSFEAAQQAATRRQTAAVKQTLPPVAPGHSVQAGVLAAGTGSAFPTIEESFAAAQAEAAG